MNDNDLSFWAVIAAGFIIYVFYLMFKFKNASDDVKRIKEVKAPRDEAFQREYDDEGIFTYTQDGFEARLNDQAISVLWSNVETIFAYKVDLMTYDELVMEVKLKNEFSFRITEEVKGWYQFIKKITEVFPSVKPDFEMDLMFPAFATNLMVVYDAQGRSIGELMKE